MRGVKRQAWRPGPLLVNTIAAVAIVGVLAGCGVGGRSAPHRESDALSSPAEQASAGPFLAGAEAPTQPMSRVAFPAAPPPTAPPVAVPSSRKVIRNGTMRLEVAALDAALGSLRALLQANGGHIANESRSQDEGQGRQAAVTCRVPAERLDEVVARLREVGREESIQLGSDDITEQYVDLEVRLRTQQQLEVRLRQLLERSSNDLSDLLEIEREVARVRTEIDQMEGRKRLWDQQVSLSTLTVLLHEPRPIGANEGGVWRTLRQAFRQAADNFVASVADVIAATGGIIPVAAALALAFWVARGLWRRTRGRTLSR